MKTIILWYRNDLRVHDLPALTAANEADTIVPLFIFDKNLTTGKNASSNRNRFLLESLQDLKQSLQERGSNLYVREGDPAKVLADLSQEVSAEAVYYTIDYTPFARKRDKAVKAALAKHDVNFKGFPGRLAIDSLEGILTKNGKIVKVFTPFWRQWEQVTRRDLAVSPQKLTSPSNLASGELPKLADLKAASNLSPDVLKGGEEAGRKRMHNWLKNGIKDYKKIHSNVAADATSRLSSYLHFGCVSVREIETLLPSGEGATAFHRQLAWRDFYHYILFEYPDNMDQELQDRYRKFNWEYNEELLLAWQKGQTGYPMVDAAMRQLNLQGWMHNRARLVVGSFLTKDLLLDWRLGQQYFMQMLIDGDNANNNGNWQWIASVGVDPAPVFRRLYNPASQRDNYDPDGIYVRKFVPELKNVPDKYLSEPWKMPEDTQQETGCIIGKDYPAPIVDHPSQRKEALARYRGTKPVES